MVISSAAYKDGAIKNNNAQKVGANNLADLIDIIAAHSFFIKLTALRDYFNIS